MLQKRTYVKPSGISAGADFIILGEKPEGIEVRIGGCFTGSWKWELEKCPNSAGF